MRSALLAALTTATVAAAVAACPSAASADTPTVTHYGGTLADGATWVGDVPADWQGTLVLYSHGFGNLDAADAPNAATQTALLDAGYALVGSSYAGPSLWALNSATTDQFAALAAMRKKISRPYEVLAYGTSMGGLISAQEDQDAHGRLDGVLTTCGLLGGAVNLNNYQLDGEYAIARLLAPGEQIQLVNYADQGQAQTAIQQLTAAVTAAQRSAAGRARIALAAALLNTPDWISGDAPPTGVAAQQSQQEQWLLGQLAFVVAGRPWIEQSAGGNASWNVGVDYASLLQQSAEEPQVQKLYRQAGLNLAADESALTADADTYPDVAALRKLTASSTLSGHISVPELTMHTISDQLAPIAYENYYRQLVQQEGDGTLLRQSYVDAIGHCNFAPSEIVAGLQVVQQRVTTGSWPSTAAASLNRRAAATGDGDGAFLDYSPPLFVNARTFRR